MTSALQHAPPQPLNETENAELDTLEATIERGLKSFIEVGNALLQIRDSKLYRTYGTFQEYLETRWALSKRYAYYVIGAAQVVENVNNGSQMQLPTNERQARPLVALEPDEQRIVWRVVTETAPDNKVTATHVKSVVNVFKEVMITGAIDSGSGESVRIADAVKAAITEETYERLQRQKAHIAAGRPPQIVSTYARLIHVDGLTRVTLDMHPDGVEALRKWADGKGALAKLIMYELPPTEA